jgi:hypothetical protein
VCLDDPDVVCFLVTNYHFVSSCEDRKAWMIKLNIKTKTLLSVAEFTADRRRAYSHFPAKLLWLCANQGNSPGKKPMSFLRDWSPN